MQPHKHLKNPNLPTVVHAPKPGEAAGIDPISFDVMSPPEFPAANDEPYVGP